MNFYELMKSYEVIKDGVPVIEYNLSRNLSEKEYADLCKLLSYGEVKASELAIQSLMAEAMG